MVPRSIDKDTFYLVQKLLNYNANHGTVARYELPAYSQI